MTDLREIPEENCCFPDRAFAMRSRGPALFYQVRFGADTRPEADDLCNRIRKAGGACFVLKNRV